MEAFNKIEPKDFERAKAVCSEFLPGNWARTADIETSVISGGYSNYLFLCSLPEQLRGEASKPDKAVVRIISGKNPLTTGGEVGEALLVSAVAAANLGPKLLGTFEGGRIEEYIDSTMFSFEDSRNKDTLRAAARQLARFHSLDVPIRRDPQVFSGKLEEFFGKSEQFSNSLIKLETFSEDIQTKIKLLEAVDYAQRFAWIKKTIGGLKTRLVLTHIDHYGNNVLVRRDRSSGSMSEFDLALVDVECCATWYRGMDIGVFLQEQAFDFSNTLDPKWVGFLDESSERLFIEEYLNLWQELNADKFDAAIDTVDNVMKEQRLLSQVFSILFAMFVVFQIRTIPDMARSPMLDYAVKRYENDTARIRVIKEQLEADKHN